MNNERFYAPTNDYMPSKRNVNIFKDHTGGWVREVKDLSGRWHVTGVYCSKQDAKDAGESA